MRSSQQSNRGFTLIEVLVALALVSTISLVVMGALAPWMGMKQKMDTERKLQDARQGLLAIYEAEAMSIDSNPAAAFKSFITSTPDAGTGGCLVQDAGFIADAGRFSDSPQNMAKDGYGNPWCIAVSGPLHSVVGGVTITYRNIAVISAGIDATRDVGTTFVNGTLSLGGDDLGVVVSGLEIQTAKLKETLHRMSRVGQAYETYFTTRYLANSSRDITIDYFNNLLDSSGAVGSTGGAWTSVSAALSGIGVSGVDASTAWEAGSDIQVGNFSEAVGSTVVRSPNSPSGTGVLPYTAVLRASVPTPSNETPVYAVQVVVGNY